MEGTQSEKHSNILTSPSPPHLSPPFLALFVCFGGCPNRPPHYSPNKQKTTRVVDGTFREVWEVDGIDLTGKSIVFHCSDESKTRAFCAPFNITYDNDKYYATLYERLKGNYQASINFESLNVDIDGLDFGDLQVTLGTGKPTPPPPSLTHTHTHNTHPSHRKLSSDNTK